MKKLLILLLLLNAILFANKVILKLDTKGHTALIKDIIVTKSGDIISASDDKTIRVWDSVSGKEKRKILGQIGAGNQGKIYAIALSPNEEFLAVGGFINSGNGERIRIYNYKTGKLLKVLKSHANAVLDLSFSKDGKYLISGAGGFTAKIWSTKSFKLLDTITFHKREVYAVKIIKKANGYFAITAGFDNKIALYNMQTREVIKSDKKSYKLYSLAVSKEHISVCAIGDEIQIYDYNLNPIQTIHSETIPTGLAYILDGEFLIAGAGSYPYNINIYSANRGYKKIQSFKRHKNLVMAVAFLDKYRAISGGGENFEIYIWDIATAKVKTKIEGVGKCVWSVGVDGDSIAWGNHSNYQSHNSRGELQKSINLKNFSITNSINKKFKRISTKNIAYSLSHRSGGDYGYSDAVLDIKKGSKIIASIVRDSTNGYGHYCYGFYKDYIISGGSNGMLKIYNLKGEEIADLVGHTGEVWSIAIDGDRLVSGSSDQTIKVWDLSKIKKQMHPQLNLFVSKDNEWIVWTPEGYFNASKKGMSYLYFHLNQGANKEALAISMQKLYDHFFRPDLIKLKLLGKEQAYKKAVGKLSYQEALKNPPPNVSFVSVDKIAVKKDNFSYKDITTNKNRAKITFNIKETQNGGVGLIRVYQEGKLIKTIGSGEIKKEVANLDTLTEQDMLDEKAKEKQKYIALANKAIEKDFNLSLEETIYKVKSSNTQNKPGNYTIELDLKSGNNEISIEAFNKTNTVTSYRESINIKADIPKHKPKLYAIVAGVSKFEAKNVPNLKYSTNDAKAIKDAIEQKAKDLYEDIEIKYLANKDVTNKNILDAINSIKQKAKLRDTVLFYISTHGRAVKGKLYLVPFNSANVKNWIDFKETFNAIQSIKSLNQIFIIDACESGKANDIVSSVYDSRASVLARSSGVHMLLATTRGTYAFESQDINVKNSVFTHKILQALKDTITDKNKDNIISVIELSTKLKESKNSNSYQYPVIRNVGKDVGLERVYDN
jgi:WD40 repeat protein